MCPDWRRAFLKQAVSDLRVAIRIARSPDTEDCHKIRYIQMAAEKFAKGFLTKGNIQPQAVHESFGRFVLALKNNARHFKAISDLIAIGPSWNRERYFKKLRENAYNLESLIPKGDVHRPNSEYPWLARDKRGSETVQVPSEYSFGVPYDISFTHVLEFLRNCESAALAEFG
jgi:hypothetical protein